MIHPAMRLGRWMTGAVVLCGALSAGCDDGTSTPDAPAIPSLRVLGDNPACDRIFLPTVQPTELRDEAFRTMVITVNGRDPSNASGVIAGNTAVTFEQQPEGGMGTVAFLSSYNAARAGGLDRLMALQQAGRSAGREFAGGVAADQIICVTAGSVRIRARIESYNEIGEIVSADAQSFVVACQSPADYDAVCGTPADDDMDVVDMGDGMGGDMGVEDGGVEADQFEDTPVLWSINFEPIPEEDGEGARYVIGIRNAGLGRRDSIALKFNVSELGEPLANIPVKFVLSTITQPAVTISTGTGAIYEADGTSISKTGQTGSVEVRVIAGDTPGLAVVRAVALRLPQNTTERAEIFREAGCTDDGGEGTECIFDALCPRTINERPGAEREEYCEVDRSSQIVIVGGIPSGRGFEFDCRQPVIPAFTVREDDRWLTSNEPGTDCTIQVADRVNGRVREGTQIFFLTEAGTVDQVASTDEHGRALTQLRVGHPVPQDVEPDEYEIDAGFLAGGYNPRDGLVRVVAVTKGEEDFVDVNGDKIYTPGEDILEPGQDLPEPYIDANDNGRYDNGEEFRDANADGVWTDINGEWDSNTEIWTSTTVLWTGELYNCRMPGRLHEDCGCAGIDGNNPPDDCRENVGGPMRFEPLAVMACSNDLCRAAPPEVECGGTPFALEEGGIVDIKLNYMDINGNCVGGINSNWGATGRGVTAIGQARGTLRDYCFTAYEKPLGRPVELRILRREGSVANPQDDGIDNDDDGVVDEAGEIGQIGAPRGFAELEMVLQYTSIDEIGIDAIQFVTFCTPEN